MQIEFIEESVEAAAWAAMRERDAGNVIGFGAQDFGFGPDAVRRCVEKHRFRIDEATHQPRTSESIDFRTLAGHPPRSPGCIEIVSYFDGRMAGAHPFFEATFQKRRVVSHRAQFISDGTAHFTARPAVDRERTRSGQRSCPLTDMVRTAAKRARNETRLLEIVILVAHVDHDG